jgi:hypothetical protein
MSRSRAALSFVEARDMEGQRAPRWRPGTTFQQCLYQSSLCRSGLSSQIEPGRPQPSKNVYTSPSLCMSGLFSQIEPRRPQPSNNVDTSPSLCMSGLSSQIEPRRPQSSLADPNRSGPTQSSLALCTEAALAGNLARTLRTVTVVAPIPWMDINYQHPEHAQTITAARGNL